MTTHGGLGLADRMRQAYIRRHMERRGLRVIEGGGQGQCSLDTRLRRVSAYYQSGHISQERF